MPLEPIRILSAYVYTPGDSPVSCSDELSALRVKHVSQGKAFRGLIDGVLALKQH